MNECNQSYNFGKQMANNYMQIAPEMVKGNLNWAVAFYKRYLYNYIYSCYDFDLPDNIPLNYFRLLLFSRGNGCFIYSAKFGWIFQPFGVTKLDLYYNVKEVLVQNWLAGNHLKGVIGVNCAIVKILDDYVGLEDLVTYYATKLAMCDGNIDINLINTKVSYLISAKDKKEAQEIKRALEEIYEGKPFAAINRDNSMAQDKGLDVAFQNLSQNFIVPDLLTSKRTILNEFLTRIGIKNANYDKKERLNSQEVTENNDETGALISVIEKNITKGFDDFEAVSGIRCNVRLNYSYEDESGVTDNAGTNALGNDAV